MFVKVCGLKTTEQIDQAIELGYDAIGVVTYPKSKRYCSPRQAAALARHARGRIKSVVVGLTYDDVAHVADQFDYTQIYEARSIPNLVLAAKEMPPPEIRFAYFLYDASIGSGVFHEFPDWLKGMADRLIVAGGLDAGNVRSVIASIQPFGVDVSSGVEKDGVKDAALMKAFIDAARSG